MYHKQNFIYLLFLNISENRCRRYLKREEGTIQTSNPYNLNENCHWYIESAIGTRIMLDFTSVRTEELKDEVHHMSENFYLPPIDPAPGARFITKFISLT